MQYRKAPCKDCPFLRSNLVGNPDYRAEGLVLSEERLHEVVAVLRSGDEAQGLCHMDLLDDEETHCAGAARMIARLCESEPLVAERNAYRLHTLQTATTIAGVVTNLREWVRLMGEARHAENDTP